MRMAAIVARYILGLLFTVFGLNGFLQFLPAPAMPPLAGQFFGVLIASHYMVPIFLLQIVCGLLFFANQFVPLALTMIAPVIVNILLFHILMNPSGIVPGLIAAICWWLVFLRVRPAFDGIFQNRRQEAAIAP
jgi:putative oxidoreductase